jgi:predicted nuclease with TOPRIM domain
MKIKESQEILNIIERLEDNNKEINIYIKKILKKNKSLELKNKKLQDEVDSLWAMMDEITKSDIENFSNILEDLQKDVIVRSLMITKKKALA